MSITQKQTWKDSFNSRNLVLFIIFIKIIAITYTTLFISFDKKKESTLTEYKIDGF